MDPKVDAYFEDAKTWREESERLRTILLECELDEAFKWNKPCYTFDDSNIAIIQKMKDFLALMFFKGVLFEDDCDALEAPGENSRSARRLCFTSLEEVAEMEGLIKDCVRAAIEVEEAGLEVPERGELELVEELQDRLDQDAALKAAFEGLTPGRQRAYNIYFSGAKQSSTRVRRIEKYAPKILDGKGMRD
jgi:uncharacterized protein YdeI (YjbR/CyaY-like superfamily)